MFMCLQDIYLYQVTIFQECEPEFLHDVVLKMKAFIFTPGDLICRKGEVAREMFIIADGLLEVIRYIAHAITPILNWKYFPTNLLHIFSVFFLVS